MEKKPDRKPTQAENALAFICGLLKDPDRGADLKYVEWQGVDGATQTVAAAIAPVPEPEGPPPARWPYPTDRPDNLPAEDDPRAVGDAQASPGPADA